MASDSSRSTSPGTVRPSAAEQQQSVPSLPYPSYPGGVRRGLIKAAGYWCRTCHCGFRDLEAVLVHIRQVHCQEGGGGLPAVTASYQSEQKVALGPVPPPQTSQQYRNVTPLAPVRGGVSVWEQLRQTPVPDLTGIPLLNLPDIDLDQMSVDEYLG